MSCVSASLISHPTPSAASRPVWHWVHCGDTTHIQFTPQRIYWPHTHRRQSLRGCQPRSWWYFRVTPADCSFLKLTGLLWVDGANIRGFIVLFWTKHQSSAHFHFHFLIFLVCVQQFKMVLWTHAEAAEEIFNYDGVLPVDSWVKCQFTAVIKQNRKLCASCSRS